MAYTVKSKPKAKKKNGNGNGNGLTAAQKTLPKQLQAKIMKKKTGGSGYSSKKRMA